MSLYYKHQRERERVKKRYKTLIKLKDIANMVRISQSKKRKYHETD